jgi:hypothetical protein
MAKTDTLEAATTLLVRSILRIWSDDVPSHNRVARFSGN